ncbi:MAG: iron ABC transporter permease [Oscillospiraceae bacterium]|nr:iron ABC transporter permease [Oscillospiraceae bacterium]
MNPIEKRHRRTVGSMGLILIVCVLGSFTLGRYPVSLPELLGVLGSRLGIPVTPFWTEAVEAAVWNIRLPRVVLSVLVGCCLAAAGASYQGVFQNPMASPDILGASAGAGFGAALAILLGASSVGITIGAFAASLMTVALVFTVSRHARGDRVLGLVLAGIMVSSLFQSGTSFLKLVADPNNQLPQITYWLMGSLSGVKWGDILFVLLPMLAGLFPLLALRWQLNVITMGDDEARAMGVNAPRIRLWIVICSTLATASAVSVSGMIGWVGLVIPHMMRRLVGSDYRFLMPASMLGGGIFLLVVDNVSRNATTAGIPIGILTAFIGAPFFLWLITGKGDHYEH